MILLQKKTFFLKLPLVKVKACIPQQSEARVHKVSQRGIFKPLKLSIASECIPPAQAHTYMWQRQAYLMNYIAINNTAIIAIVDRLSKQKSTPQTRARWNEWKNEKKHGAGN